MNNQLTQILQRLNEVNDAYSKLFEQTSLSQMARSPLVKSPVLSMKHYTSLFPYLSGLPRKVFSFFQQSSVAQTNSNKQLLMRYFKIYLRNMLSGTVLIKLGRCHPQTHEQEYLHTLSQQWENFKRFTFYYHAVLQNANDHYEQAYKINQNQGQTIAIDHPDSVFPVAVISISIFKQEVLISNADRIRRIVISLWRLERQLKKVDRQALRAILEIVWSCGLGELARIKSKTNQIIFFRQQKVEHLKSFKHITRGSEVFFQNYLLNDLVKDAEEYYLWIYENKIRPLSPIEDIMAVASYVEQEKELANYYLFTAEQKKLYLSAIYKILNEKDLDLRINRENGIMSLLEKFRSDSDEYLSEIKPFFKLLIESKETTIGTIEKIIRQHISKVGTRINKKINRHRQYIAQMIQLKKVVNRLIEQVMQKDIRLCLTRDQTFRKLLDSLEASRSLAEYIDFTIKQCIKLRVNEQVCLQRFKNAFLILQNLVAQDSLLIYHQQLLSKRLIDSLNEPKIEIEILFIKKLSEKLGTVSLSTHMSMIKDIENSIELTQRYSQKMPFVNFSWSIRVFNPVFWPDSLSKTKFEMYFRCHFREPPNYLFKECETLQTLYKDDYDYRNLNWKLDRGFSLFEGKYVDKKFRFQAENIYVMLLLHISDSPQGKMLYGSLKQKFKPVKTSKDSNPSLQLDKYILVLVESKLILRQCPFSDPITEGEQLKINMGYTPTNPNLKPNQPLMIRPSQQMQKSFHQSNLEKNKIMKEREKLVEAALVKIMKHTHATGNNCITFPQLYHAIQNHSYLKNFEFSESTVKERLEELLALNYCERDQDDRKIYHYIA